jgi:2-deoxy-D-gluconate 3-dehydrogenase
MAPIARRHLPGLFEQITPRLSAKKWGTGNDFARIPVFLACAASDYVTGVAIPVDGGYSSQGI